MYRIHQISVSDCKAMGGNVPMVPTGPHGDIVPVADPSPLAPLLRVLLDPPFREDRLPPHASKLARVLSHAATIMLVMASEGRIAHADHRPLVRQIRVVGSGQLPPFQPFPVLHHATSVRTSGTRVYPRRYSSKRQQRRWVVIRDQDAGWLTPPSRFARTRQGHPLIETPDGIRALLPVPREVAQPH